MRNNEVIDAAYEPLYAALEAKMLQYADIVNVPVIPCGEQLVAIEQTQDLLAQQVRKEMLAVTGNDIYVRRSVADKLIEASKRLAIEWSGTQLQVAYGYRALSIQRRNFERERARLDGTVPEELLDEATHRYVAIPEIAGHPAGAAVDVQMIREGKPVNCGTPIWSFTKDSYAFSPRIVAGPMSYRRMLRDIMLSVGFAPFDGEWWHFSYGDKEWAAYYGMPNAIYEQVEFSTMTTPEV